MFAPEAYFPLFMNSMLVLILLSVVIYGQGSSRAGFSVGFNAFMAWTVGGLLVLFIGTRPIDAAFVDMTTYAVSYEITQHTGRDFYSDWGFNLLTGALASFASVEIFFLVCAAVYILPLIVGMRRAHSNWGYAAFLALASGLSFFSYGVNGLRQGMATSLLIAAFAFWDNKLVMVLLMIAAESMHKSALLPIASFIAAGFYPQPWFYAVAWTGALATSVVFGDKLSNFFVGLTFAGDDERLSSYTANAGLGGDKGGFRLDFVLYSIVPIAISYAMAGATTKKDPFYRRLVCAYLLANTFWIIVMYAAFSNRFAYLSWFMMPWIIIYPFLPEAKSRRISHEQEAPRFALIGAALVAHFAFTYVMTMFVYSTRG